MDSFLVKEGCLAILKMKGMKMKILIYFGDVVRECEAFSRRAKKGDRDETRDSIIPSSSLSLRHFYC